MSPSGQLVALRHLGGKTDTQTSSPRGSLPSPRDTQHAQHGRKCAWASLCPQPPLPWGCWGPSTLHLSPAPLLWAVRQPHSKDLLNRPLNPCPPRAQTTPRGSLALGWVQGRSTVGLRSVSVARGGERTALILSPRSALQPRASLASRDASHSPGAPSWTPFPMPPETAHVGPPLPAARRCPPLLATDGGFCVSLGSPSRCPAQTLPERACHTSAERTDSAVGVWTGWGQGRSCTVAELR